MSDPTSSHVQFDATVDDLVDVQLRFLRKSKVASSWPRVDGLFISLGTALAVFVLIRFLLDAGLAAGFIGAGIAALVAYITYPHDYERRIRRRLSRLLTEQFGKSQSLLCEVELRPKGIWVRQGNIEIIHDWAALRAIQDTPAGVEFTFSGGLLLVRSRAFATRAERDEFLARSRALAPHAAA